MRVKVSIKYKETPLEQLAKFFFVWLIICGVSLSICALCIMLHSYKDNHAYIQVHSFIKGDWVDFQDDNIFLNEDGEHIDSLYPNSGGVFHFKVKNKAPSAAVIHISLNELNPENIPMVFRLYINNVYVCGDENSWLFAEDILHTISHLAPFEEVFIDLEWAWSTNLGYDYIDHTSYTLQVVINYHDYLFD